MHETAEIVDDIQDFYRSWCHEDIGRFAQGFPKDSRVFRVDFRDVKKALPDVADDYEQHPDTIRDAFENALATFELPAPVDLSDAGGPIVRFTNVADALEHRVHTVGDWSPTALASEFAVVRGQVSKRTQSKILVSTAHWQCKRCGNEQPTQQSDGYTTLGSGGLQEPQECVACGREGPFVLDEERTISDGGQNFQRVRLQRPPDAGGETRDTLDIHLTDDLVDTAKPGDRVAVGTAVRGKINDGGAVPTMSLYGKAEDVEHTEANFSDIDIDAHRDEIEAIADSGDPYQQVIDSILPSHRGDEDLKEAIAYQLFGGVDKELPDGNHVRGTIHIFCVGDPGVGKSTLLRYVQRLAPRSVYTTGTGSTAAGLTCAAMKDDFGDGGWTLEAGALVEANDGVACIDELDDMEEADRAGLLEAMSDQSISVSKAGMNAELPAHTRVLAAANPELGRFDAYEPIADQIDVHPALLSRFDLIFTMTDRPDMDEDVATAAHINQGTKAGQRRARGDDAGVDSIDPPIGPELMRAYVALAREQTPVLTDAADARIQREYAQIRQLNQDGDAIPTTPRMVGALTRLAEAAARIRLGEYVTEDDVERAITIYRASMEDVGKDPETGDLDADMIETGTADSQRARMNRIASVVDSLADEHSPGAPVDAVLDHGQLSKWGEAKLQHSIEKLKQEGKLYNPKNGFLDST